MAVATPFYDALRAVVTPGQGAGVSDLMGQLVANDKAATSRRQRMAQALQGLQSSGGGIDTGGGSPVANVGGNVNQWISAALRDIGQSDNPGLHNAVALLIQHESGGNPNAVNMWDSNARAGHPSKGLAQTIPSTFAAYRDPRLPNNIFDPVANLVAGLRYGTSRYGSITNIPGIASVLHGGAYRGY